MLGAELLPEIREGVLEEGVDQAWNDSVAALSSAAAMSIDEAELRLAEALSWKVWIQCNRAAYIKKQMPDLAKLQKALSWVIDGPLGFNQDQLRKAVRESPKVYLDAPAEKYEAALASAPDMFSNPSDFKALLLDAPFAIELTYNCESTGCAAQCGNCWRVAMPRLTGIAKKPRKQNDSE